MGRNILHPLVSPLPAPGSTACPNKRFVLIISATRLNPVGAGLNFKPTLRLAIVCPSRFIFLVAPRPFVTFAFSLSFPLLLSVSSLLCPSRPSLPPPPVSSHRSRHPPLSGSFSSSVSRNNIFFGVCSLRPRLLFPPEAGSLGEREQRRYVTPGTRK